MSAEDCGDCPVAAASRRAFLRDVGLAVAATLVGAAGSPATALAQAVFETIPSAARGRRLTYPIPAGDTVSVDSTNGVILARWQDRVYAFSAKCPHRGSKLEWRADERRVYCPKHKARFQADGTHDSGRRSRDLDRFDLRRQANSLEVDTGSLRRSDLDPTGWRAAVVTLDTPARI